MHKIEGSLTIFFDAPFWVGFYERRADDGMEIGKITFGAEPKDYEVYDYILQHWHQLQFAPATVDERRGLATNPKRRQREASLAMQCRGISTKSQQALALQREADKGKRRRENRQRREEEKQRQFDLKQRKKKQKHRGH